MKQMLPIILTVFTVLPFSMKGGWSADYAKGWDAYATGDYATALSEWKPLAKKGNVDALFYVGRMYRKGIGVFQNNKTAVEWYRLAAEQGDAIGQYNLGVMYALGQGIPVNYVAAYMWGTLAVKGGFGRGVELRDFVSREMTVRQTEEAQTFLKECIMHDYKNCGVKECYWWQFC